ncbi:unnamed protein product [Adineta steineri]|uniref:Uncharacterized protein n=1 Tax=Adineta steineri TaxID=433720 RepID=A0A819PI60_9BILA|nr:unnamed protein product [Adineta steineri]
MNFASPLQLYFFFGFIQNASRTPVNLNFRPQRDPKLFYHTNETIKIVHNDSNIQPTVERREIESAEHVVTLETTRIHIINLVVKLNPPNETESARLLKRPYFDRLEKRERDGDFRSLDQQLRSAWMFFPSPECLITPDIDVHEGQKWSAIFSGGAFEAQYELIKVDDEQHLAFVEGRNCVCSNGLNGNKRWNGSWTVDTRTGIIKQLNIKIEHREDHIGKVTHKTIAKVLVREAEAETLFDYELDDGDEEL